VDKPKIDFQTGLAGELLPVRGDPTRRAVTFFVRGEWDYFSIWRFTVIVDTITA